MSYDHAKARFLQSVEKKVALNRALIDVRCSSPSVLPALFIVGGAVGVSIALSMLGTALFGGGLDTGMMTVGALVIALLFALLRLHPRAVRKRVDRLMRDGFASDLGVLAGVVAEELLGHEARHAFVRLMQILIRHRRANQTLRLWWSAPPESIDPLNVAFEPRRLDESDAGFIELSAVSSLEGRSFRRPRGPAGHDDHNGGFRRWSLRQLRLGGGWVFAGVFTLCFVQVSMKSYQTGCLTPAFWFWGALLLLHLIIVQSSRPFLGHWWLLPGGLLRRKGQRSGYESDLHVFDRKTSALCLYQTGVERWLMCVADTFVADWTVVTSAEATLLLRAWLSPISPPPVEKLSDFV